MVRMTVGTSVDLWRWLLYVVSGVVVVIMRLKWLRLWRRRRRRIEIIVRRWRMVVVVEEEVTAVVLSSSVGAKGDPHR